MGMFKFIVFESLIKNFDFKSFDLVLYKINDAKSLFTCSISKKYLSQNEPEGGRK